MAVDVIIDPLTGQIYWNDSQSTAQSIAISGNGTDIIKTVGYSLQFNAAPTGFITSSSSSTTITGSGTNFVSLFGTSAAASGAILYTAQGTSIGTISSVTNDTSLTLQSNAAGTFLGIPFRYTPPTGTDRLIFSDSSTPLYPATTGANLGSATYRWSLYASTGDITNASPSTINLVLDKSGLGTTESPALQFLNSTLATSGAQYQFAPWNEFRGKAWNSTSSASNDIRLRMGMAALSGATPTSEFVIASSVDTGTASWYYPLTLNSTTNDAILYLNNAAASIGKLLTNGTTSSYALEIYNYAIATSGVPSQWSPAFEMNGSAWNTSTATSNVLRFRSEVQVATGNPISGTLVWKSAITTSYSATPVFSNRMSISDTSGVGIWNSNTAVSYFKAGSQASDIRYTLPIVAPTANQVLTATSISGADIVLGWTTTSVSSGSGTVSAGTINQLAFYSGTSTTSSAPGIVYSVTTTGSLLTLTAQSSFSNPLKVVGIASQSAPLVQVQTSTPTTVFQISSTGIINVGTWNASIIGLSYGGTNTSTFATPSGLVYYNGTQLVTANTSASGIIATDATFIPFATTSIPTSVTIGGSYIYRAGGTDVPLADGGTNASLTAASGGIVYSTPTAMAITAAGSTGQSLIAQGTSAPIWGAVSLGVGSSVTGLLTFTNGGTNTTTYTTNGLLYSDGTSLKSTAAAITGQTIIGVTSGAPVFGALTLGTASSVTGILLTGNGGTGTSVAPTTWGIVFGNASNVYQSTGTSSGASQTILSVVAGAPVWGALPLGAGSSVTGILGIANGGTNTSTFATPSGLVYYNGTQLITTNTTASGVVVTNASFVPSVSTDIPTAVTIGGQYIYRIGGTDVSLADGGTNASLTAASGGIIYSTPTAMAITAAGTAGQSLIAQGTSAPVFGALTLSNNSSVTGILLTGNGGTGTSAAANTWGVVYGGPAGQHLSTGTSSGANQTILSVAAGAPVWGALPLGAGSSVTGLLTFTNGGTNTTTYTSNGLVYSDGTSLKSTAAGITGQVILGVTSGAPVFGAINLSTASSVTGILGIANGGTNTSTFATPSGLVYYNGTQLITTNTTASGIVVTNASYIPSVATDIPTAVTIGGSYIYRAGGTDVPLTDGGTNASLTAASGGIVYSTPTAMAISAAGSTGQSLIAQGTSAPIWGAISLSTASSVTGILLTGNGGTGTSAAANTWGIVYGGPGGQHLSTGTSTGASQTILSVSGGAPIWGALPLGTASSVTGILSVANGGTGIATLTANYIPYGNGTGAFLSTSSLNYEPVGGIFSSPYLKSTNSIGLEGGEITLAIAQTTTITTSVTIDVYGDKVRIFESGGTNRGAYIDLSAASAGVGSNLLGAGGSGTVGSGTINQLAYYSGATQTASAPGIVYSVTTTGSLLTLTAQSSFSNPLKVVGITNQSAPLMQVQTSTPTTVFQISSTGIINVGTWNGSIVGLAYGGTNTSTFATPSGLVYYNGTQLVTANTSASGIIATDATFVPFATTSIPTAVTIGGSYIYRAGGTDVPLADGGTNASLTAASGGIVYSTPTAMAITAAGSTGQVLIAQGTSAPIWGAVSLGVGSSVTGTLTLGNGGTGLTATAPGANYILGVNNANNALEYKQLTATGITIVHSAGGISLASASVFPGTINQLAYYSGITTTSSAAQISYNSAGTTLTVTASSATSNPLRLIAAASQTANFLTIENSSGNSIFTISPTTSGPSAKVTIAGTASNQDDLLSITNGGSLTVAGGYAGGRGVRLGLRGSGNSNNDTYIFTIQNGPGDLTPLVFSADPTTGYGMQINQASSGFPLSLKVPEDSTANTVKDVISIERTTTGAATSGIGSRISYRIEQFAGTTILAAGIDGILTNTAVGTFAGALIFNTNTAGLSTTLVERVRIDNAAVTLSPVGTAGGSTNELRFSELAASGSDYTAFKAPDSLASPLVYTLPSTAPIANQVLAATVVSGSSITLAWATDATGAGGSGTVGAGTINQLAFYAGSSTTASAPGIVYSATTTGSLLTLTAQSSFSNPFKVVGIASQSAPLVQVQTSTPTTVFQISSTGIINVGTWNGSVVGLAYGGTNTSTFATPSGLVYYNGTQLVTANTSASGIIATDATFVPYSTTSIPTAVTIGGSYIYRAGGTDVPLADGGTNASLTAASGGIIYSTPTAMAITAAGTAGQALVAQGTSAPSWGSVGIAGGGTNTSTFATPSGLIYYNGTQLITTNTTASGVVVTNASYIPSVSTDIPTAVTIGSQYIYRAGGTDVPLLDGGTNASLTAASGGIVYSTPTALAINTAGTAGQALIGQGTSAPTFGTLGMFGGGTGLNTTAPGANLILGMTTTNSGLAYKQLVQGTNVTISHTDTSVTITATGGSAAAGGSNTQIQYNSSNTLAGASNFTYASPLVSINNATNFTTTSTAGLELKYTTASGTTAVDANSPALDFIGRSYTSSRDNLARFRQEVQTSASATAHSLVWSSSYDTSVASYTKRMTVDTVDGLGLWNYAGASPGTIGSYFKTGNQAASIKYTLPIVGPSSGQVLTATTVSGVDITLGWATPAAGSGSGTVNSGTINQLAYYSGTTTTASAAAMVYATSGDHLTITAQAVGVTPLQLTGTAGQTANLFDVSTNAANVFAINATGIVTTATWQASTIGTAYGGTGQSTYTDGQLLIGNSTGNTLTKANLTAGNGIGVTNGSGAITIRTQRVMNMQLASGYNPTVGADTAIMRVPESPDDGTTSLTFNLRNLFCRVETPSAGTSTFQVEYYTGTSAFSATNLLTTAVSLTGASTYEFTTTGFTTTVLTTGTKVRLNFSTVDTTHANFSINLLLEEQ